MTSLSTPQAAPATGDREERIERIRQAAYRIRRNALDMGEVQGQGYIGQALGVADVLAVVYTDQLRYRPEDPHWPDRDRFLLSRSEEHTSELQSRQYLVCRLLLDKKKKT